MRNPKKHFDYSDISYITFGILLVEAFNFPQNLRLFRTHFTQEGSIFLYSLHSAMKLLFFTLDYTLKPSRNDLLVRSQLAIGIVFAIRIVSYMLSSLVL